MRVQIDRIYKARSNRIHNDVSRYVHDVLLYSDSVIMETILPKSSLAPRCAVDLAS